MATVPSEARPRATAVTTSPVDLPTPDARPETRSTTRLANDAWESLFAAHAAVLKQVSAGDRWSEVDA